MKKPRCLTLEVLIKPELRAASDKELPAHYTSFDFGLLPGGIEGRSG